MKNQLLTLTSHLTVALSLMLAGLPLAHAEKADRDKPMNVSADALKVDDLKQTSEFSGNVVITKGTLVIRAQEVVVRQDPQGYQFGTATAPAGQRAFFRQKREKLDEWIEGEAQTLLYDGRADTVRFTQSAVIRRYRGTTLTDETSGHTIVYDNTTDVFTIDGGKKPTGAADNNVVGGRVRAVLTPQTAASAAAQAANANGPSVNLRTSTELSSPKK